MKLLVKANKQVVAFYLTQILVFLNICNLMAQNEVPINGSVFIRNFSEKVYGAHNQSFDIVQTKNGLLYFANFAGILEFDGVNWNTIRTYNGLRATTLYAFNNTVYCGARGDFGVLVPDKNNAPVFKSLITESKNADKIKKLLIDTINKTDTIYYEIADIIKINTTIYYVSPKAIFSYQNGTTDIELETNTEIKKSFFVNNTWFLFAKQLGLVIYRNKKIEKVKYENELFTLLDVNAIVKSAGNEIVVFSGNQGVFKFQGNILRKVIVENDNVLRLSEIKDALLLNNGYYAIATANQGILIYTSDWKFVEQIDKKAGIVNDVVNAVYQTSENMLWLATNKGISMLEYPSVFSTISEKNNLFGEVNDITKVFNRIFAATTNGLYFIDNNKVDKVADIKYPCNQIVSKNNILYVATAGGVYSVTNKNVVTKLTSTFSIALSILNTDSTTILVSNDNGLMRYKISGFKLTDSVKISNVNTEITKILSDNNGNFWMETSSTKILKLNALTNKITVYDSLKGVPAMYSIAINIVNDHILLGTERGIFKYNNTTDSFSPDLTFSGPIKFPTFITFILKNNQVKSNLVTKFWVTRIVNTPSDNVFTNQGDEKYIVAYNKTSKNTYFRNEKPFFPVKDFNAKVIFPESNTVCWFGGTEGILRYDSKVPTDYKIPFVTKIRRITLVATDSVIFKGMYYNPDLNQV